MSNVISVCVFFTAELIIHPVYKPLLHFIHVDFIHEKRLDTHAGFQFNRLSDQLLLHPNVLNVKEIGELGFTDFRQDFGVQIIYVICCQLASVHY